MSNNTGLYIYRIKYISTDSISKIGDFELSMPLYLTFQVLSTSLVNVSVSAPVLEILHSSGVA